MQKIGDITDTADGNGEFTDGNVAGNVQPTELMAAWFNSVQREIIAVLAAAGIVPDKTNDKQLSEAIQAILSKGISGSGYLISENNLSDLKNASEALGHLGLDNVGNWQAVQANGGKHSSGNHHLYIDWDGKKLHYTVDDTDVGEAFTTQNPPTAAQTGAYPMTGGYLNEEVSATVISNLKDGSAGQALYAPMWRSCLKNRGGDMDFKDGASACFRLVEVISNYAFAEILVDGFGIVRSFEFRNDGTIHAPSSVYAGQGFIAPDGNLYGPAWGGYANNWILAQINALNVAINNQLNNMNADRNNCVRATARGGRQHKVGGDWVGDWEAPAGCRVTGFNTNEGGDGRKMGIYYRADYYYTNASGWVQAGDIA
ncbi:hypothetical protein [Pantoea eucalypti]|uniref:hypothetical protein n=1 Tax=Pantoea eucalypti TaxID=470933 RepID=UPI0015E82BF6|nr:hypothetical protein [Pantoea eucalypti]